ncbi:MAG TPA: TetR/AcrR family transcriptional regulator [Solirubrobacteraceae bacterium]|nr:TetR/AcrR family transcriptional regulator [Solirubrobacteraceae bacterium]
MSAADHSTRERVAQPRRTQAQRRESTRTALLDAAVDCLIEEGYAGLTTRRVAERAGVAQSTQMHYFPTREAFLVEALSHVARRMTAEVLERLDFADLAEPDRREAVLDETWRTFTSPLGRAIAQLWVAAYNEPELARALRDLERNVAAIIAGATASLFPEQAGDPEFDVLTSAALALFVGLALVAPVLGPEEMEERWQVLKPTLLAVGENYFDFQEE